MRSKTLLTANILATIYSAVLLWIYGGAVIEAGGTDFIDAIGAYFKFAFDVIQTDSEIVTILYVVMVLLCVHISAIVLGCLFGWIAYIAKKSGMAKFSATLYLISTICFPIYLIFSLPITIIGYIGGGKQKKLNKAAVSS